MNAPTDPTLGHMIRGYRLEKKLGTGNLTTLYYARTEELWLPPELTVMLLHIPASLSARAQAQFAERFTREASHLIKLRHPSLHPLFGYDEGDRQFYLFYPTYTFSITLGRELRKKRYWSPSEVFAILAPLSSAFDYLHHQGMAYQFFTPSNILLQEHAAPEITGAGLLQLLLLQGLDDELYTDEPHRHLKNVAGDYVGLSTYMAPEVIRGEPPNTRSDIYSLGILLFELLSGQPPFGGKTYMDIAQKHLREPLPSLRVLAPSVPLALELVINRALHRNPDQRFATAGELITAFSHVLNERLRSPAYLSHEPLDAKKHVSPLPEITREHHLKPVKNVEDEKKDKKISNTTIDLPISTISNETYISTTGEFAINPFEGNTSTTGELYINSLDGRGAIDRTRISTTGEFAINPFEGNTSTTGELDINSLDGRGVIDRAPTSQARNNRAPTTDTFDNGHLITGRDLSIELSTPENINKMAQHIQILRERIQGEYKK